MHEPRRHVACGELRGPLHDQRQQAGGVVARLAVQVAQHVSDQPRHPRRVAPIRQPLKRADADMPVAQPHQHRRARRRRLVAARQFLARLDQRQRAAGRHAQRLQHLGRQDLAHATLQRQPPVAEAAVRRLARALGAEIHQPTCAVVHLREGKAPPVTDIGVVVAKLVAVIAQRQRLRQRVGQRREPAEVRHPFGIGQRVQPDLGRRAAVAKAQPRLGKIGRRHRIPEVGAERQQRSGRAVCLRGERHPAIWGRMAVHDNLWWQSADGVRLHARDYPGNGPLPIVCLPGLTRNARDYRALAERLAGAWRVIAVDFRGRGESGAAKDPASYVPQSYVADVQALLADQGIDRFVAVGTSLGGLVTMMLALAEPGRVAGALLNDVGPEIEAAGLQRIRGYVGRASSFPTWMHAARAVADANRDVHPNFAIEDWLGMAKRLYRLTGSGKITLDYDLKIAEPFRTTDGAAPPDLWPALAGLSGAPVLIVRGERSDVLSPATAARMVAALPGAELVTVPATGHAPTLAEPEALAGIDRLLARVGREPAPV